jgi:hypothetical protein
MEKRIPGSEGCLGTIIGIEPELDLSLCVSRINCFSHFLNGNGFGNRKW